MRIRHTVAGWIDFDHVQKVSDLEESVYEGRYFTFTMMFQNKPFYCPLGDAYAPWEISKVNRQYREFVEEWKRNENEKG